MRLAQYDYSQSGAYFVTICTYNRVHLFGEIEPDSESVGVHLRVHPNNPEKLIEKWLYELENKYQNLTIDKFVIMPDHIHMIINNHGACYETTGTHAGVPLPEIIKWFKTMTTNDYINGVKNGLFPPFDKHIWQRNYYEHIIRNQHDYEEIWYYIEQNPVAFFGEIVGTALRDRPNEPMQNVEKTKK